jgi:hypothetical protein
MRITSRTNLALAAVDQVPIPANRYGMLSAAKSAQRLPPFHRLPHRPRLLSSDDNDQSNRYARLGE